VLGASQESNLGTSVTFQFPEKPFYSDIELHPQHMVVSVAGPNIGDAMLTPPFIPQLNEYYGRNAYFMYDRARAERGSLGIIQEVTSEQLTLRALPFTQVLAKVFDTFGMKAKPARLDWSVLGSIRWAVCRVVVCSRLPASARSSRSTLPPPVSNEPKP